MTCRKAYAITLAIRGYRGSSSEAYGAHLLPHVTAHAQVMTCMHQLAIPQIVHLESPGGKALGQLRGIGLVHMLCILAGDNACYGGDEGLTLLLS